MNPATRDAHHERPYQVLTRRADGTWVPAVAFRSITEAQAFARAQAAMFGRDRVRINRNNPEPLL